jgi:conjugation system TraG family ATPase
MEKKLRDVLPIFGIEQDCLLSRQGDVTVAFEVVLPEIFTLSEQEYEALHQTFIKAIKVLPRCSVFHKQDWFTEARYAADFSKDQVSFLAGSSERFFNERPYLDHRCYIYVTRKPVTRKPTTSLFSNLIRNSIVPSETIHPKRIQEFFDCIGQFKKILEDCGFIQLRRLSSDELGGTDQKAGVLERYLNLHMREEELLLQDISFADGIKVGDNYCQMYTLADVEDLPTYCGSRINYDKYSTDRTKFSIGFASVLGQLLSCNHLYNQYIFIDDAQKTIKQLENKRLRLQSLSAYSRENAISRDAVNEFLNEAIGQQRLPVKAHFNVVVWTPEKEKIKDLKNQVSAALAQMDASPKQETTGAPQIFWAGLPGNEGDFPLNDTFDTFAEQACCFLNLETNYYTSLSPFGIRLGDRLTGRPVHLDLWDAPAQQGLINNRNLFCLSGSGGGKSFWTNHLVRSYREQGVHVLIVDVGHSYNITCSLLNGYYFTYDENNPIRFNPFYLAPGDVLDTEMKESIKTLLLALWKKSDENYNRSEYVALSNALQLYFEHLKKNPSIFPCFDSFYEFLQEKFVKVLEADKVKEKDFDVSNFLYVLRPFYRDGEFGFLLNAKENLDLLNEKFIVFELDNIKNHPILFSVTSIILMQTFISKMRKLRGVKKMIVIEEAWKAIAKEGMAEYIKYLFKTVRKFYGSVVLVTQEIEDIISSDIIKQAIINNADIKVLLDQSKYQYKFDLIQEMLGITEKQKAEILSINKGQEPNRRYKDLWICLGPTHSKVYRLEVSPEEYFTYTSDQKEKLRVMQAADKFGGDYRKAIAYVASGKGQ